MKAWTEERKAKLSKSKKVQWQEPEYREKNYWHPWRRPIKNVV